MTIFLKNDSGEKIKNAVKTNFNQSPTKYDLFEKKYKLFNKLTIDLAKKCEISEGNSILDIGCGTGISTFVLSKMTSKSVIGIDFSEKMIEKAKSQQKVNKIENIEFIFRDADELSNYWNSRFDFVLYNASLFLIPNTKNTLSEAYSVLKENGKVGFNILKGAEYNNFNIFEIVKEKSPHLFPSFHKPIMDLNKIEDILKGIGYKNIEKGITKIVMKLMEIKEFFSIPAMSASLFPKINYAERVIKIDKIFNFLKNESVENAEQNWIYFIATK